MNLRDQITKAFEEAMEGFEQCESMRLLAASTLSLTQYKCILREIYFYSREDPQIQALATVYFRGEQRQLVKPFLRHAISEVGHDQLALNDLSALGEDVARIKEGDALSTTLPLISFPFYVIGYRTPIGYLGYLYFLEFMPTSAGQRYKGALTALGVPEEAMTFLQEHVTVDMGHNRLMDCYIDELVRTQRDAREVCLAIQTTASLYAQMLDGAVGAAAVETIPKTRYEPAAVSQAL